MSSTPASPTYSRSRLVRRVAVPKDIEAVTTIAGEREVDPVSVGMSFDGAERIWRAVVKLYKAGLHPAIALCLRRRGEVVLDRAVGYAKGGGPFEPADAPKVLATPDTPYNTFSSSKAVTAMLIHLLDQRRVLHLDDPVCEYIPEFAAHGKRAITIRHVLAHRAGIPNIPPEVMDLDLLAKPEEVTRILCETKPTWRPGRRLAYHAISGGFVLGEVVRRVTGKDIRQLLDEEIRKPLGFRWLNYGVDPSEVELVADNHFTGLPLTPPASTIFQRFLGVPFERVAELGNDPRYLTGVIPSANIVATPNEMTRFYQLLLNQGELDGVRIFDARTVRRAVSEQSYLEIDLSLGLPLRYGMGFMLGGRWASFFGSNTQYAFGHLGFINVVAWADPQRDITVSLMTTGKPFLYPEITRFLAIPRVIATYCPSDGKPF